jgi:hypothetical protein
MSYRNDHDAALARVDALERELAVLKGERIELPQSPRRMPWLVLAVSAAALIASLIFGLFIKDERLREQTEQRVAQAEEQVASVSRDELELCVAKLPPRPLYFDPLADKLQIVAASGACRNLVHRYVDGGLLANDEHRAAAIWAWAEDDLANSISLITEYYRVGPDVDDHATERQLWLEYDRLLRHRNAALEVWRTRH